MQHDGSGSASPDRWRQFGAEIKPWRKTGRNIVVVPQAPMWHHYMTDYSSDMEWAESVLLQLRFHTDRPVIISRKPFVKKGGVVSVGGGGLSDLIEDAWAVVVLSSAAAVWAVTQGVPVFCLTDCAASMMGLSDLRQIERPAYPDGREQWIANLCANQWTLDEFRSGKCWADLQDRAR